MGINDQYVTGTGKSFNRVKFGFTYQHKGVVVVDNWLAVGFEIRCVELGHKIPAGIGEADSWQYFRIIRADQYYRLIFNINNRVGHIGVDAKFVVIAVKVDNIG